MSSILNGKERTSVGYSENSRNEEFGKHVDETVATDLLAKASIGKKRKLNGRAIAVARRQLSRWKSQRPFNTSGAFNDFLDICGLNEDEILIFLSKKRVAKEKIISSKRVSQEALNEAQELLRDMTTSEVSYLGLLQPWLVEPIAFFIAEFDKLSSQYATHSRFSRKGVISAAMQALAGRLRDLVEGVCILERNIAQIRGKISGGNSTEIDEKYSKLLIDPSIRKKITREYPALLDLAKKMICDWRINTLELLTHFCTDLENIAEILNEDPSSIELLSWDESVGDRHRSGRCVAILELRGGQKIVYKPRSLAVDKGFAKFIDWMNKELPNDVLRYARCVDLRDHGWMEYIHHEPHKKPQESRSFFRKQGKFLAIFYALHATDMHMENLIANRSDPIYIDLETLFHPQGYAIKSSGPEPTWPVAVNMTMALPGSLNVLGNMKNDISALLSLPERQPSFRSMVAKSRNGKSVLVEDTGPLNRTTHLPYRDEVVLNPGDYVGDVVDGFKEAADVVIRNKGFLLSSDGLDLFFKGCIVRVLIRPTVVYQTLIKNSIHPTFLRHPALRFRLFSRLYRTLASTKSLNRALVSEMESLSKLDVPIFIRTFEEQSLISANDTSLNCSLPSARAILHSHLADLSQQGVEKQSEIVRDIISLTATAIEERRLAAPSATQIMEDSAARCAGVLLESAHYCSAGTYWICSNSPRDAELTWSAGISDIYSGQLGIALYFAYAYKYLGDPNFKSITLKTIATVNAWTEYGSQNFDSIGVFCGSAGYAYAMIHIGSVLELPELVSRGIEHVKGIRALGLRDDIDVISGSSGIILFLSALLHYMGASNPLKRDLLDVIYGYAFDILSSMKTGLSGPHWEGASNSTSIVGFAHGTSGIAAALCRAAKLLGRNDIYIHALHALEAESREWKSLYLDKERSASTNVPGTWCGGISGMLLGRALCAKSVPEQHPLRGDFLKQLASMLVISRHISIEEDDASLCHGSIGNFLTWKSMTNILSTVNGLRGSDIPSRNKCYPEGRRMLCGDSIYSDPFTTSTSPGLMMGNAGIGYGLLSMKYPLPNILSLDAPRESFF